MNINYNNAMYTSIAEEYDENIICDLSKCKDCTFDCKLNPNLKHIYGSDDNE